MLGALESLARMKQGPCLFSTTSRNFKSWIDFKCPEPFSPGGYESPAWKRWYGIPAHNGENPHNVLSSRPEPEEVETHFVEKFGHKHVVLLVPNPCNWWVQEKLPEFELQLANKLEKFCFG